MNNPIVTIQWGFEVNELEEKKSGSAKIVIIVVVIIGIIFALLVIAGVFMAGITFLWADSFTDEVETTVLTMNVVGTLDDSEDLLYLEVISGTYDWADYRVTVDGTTLALTSEPTTSAGGTAIFTGGQYTAGNLYNVKIVNIAEDKVVWEDDIIAKP